MNRLLVSGVLALSLVTFFCRTPPANAQGLIFGGEVRAVANGNPIPGLTVFLVHPQLGRSFPTLTNWRGEFVFANRPYAGRYYLEIYWGPQIVYRGMVFVPSQPQTIYL